MTKALKHRSEGRISNLQSMFRGLKVSEDSSCPEAFFVDGFVFFWGACDIEFLAFGVFF